MYEKLIDLIKEKIQKKSDEYKHSTARPFCLIAQGMEMSLKIIDEAIDEAYSWE